MQFGFARRRIRNVMNSMRYFCHQMLGYPLYIQDEDMAPGQTLLLQIDTDEEDDGPCWMWGDCGRLFFWIRPKDLAARRFDRIMFVLECG